MSLFANNLHYVNDLRTLQYLRGTAASAHNWTPDREEAQPFLSHAAAQAAATATGLSSACVIVVLPTAAIYL